jgi:hypothetical protein
MGDLGLDEVVANAVRVGEAFEDCYPVSREQTYDCIVNGGRQVPMYVSGNDDASLDVFLFLGRRWGISSTTWSCA